MKNRNLTLLSKRFENQLNVYHGFIAVDVSILIKNCIGSFLFWLRFTVTYGVNICLSIWCCRVIVNSRRFLTSNWIPLVPGELGFNHDVKILVGSLASEFLGWTWNTNVGIPMLDIGIPMSEFQCPT